MADTDSKQYLGVVSYEVDRPENHDEPRFTTVNVLAGTDGGIIQESLTAGNRLPVVNYHSEIPDRFVTAGLAVTYRTGGDQLHDAKAAFDIFVDPKTGEWQPLKMTDDVEVR